MLQEIFTNQRLSINNYFETVDQSKIQLVFDYLFDTEGLLLVSGVGKSGIIAEKIAATLISTGTKALALSPTNFLHGDLGIASPQDKILLFSKSGESEELLDIVPFLKKKGTPIVAIHCNPHSRLARVADQELHLPLLHELCPYDLAPTSSTEIQLIVGDLLAMYLMRKKSFSQQEYANNHPSGAIGKKLSLTVHDLMHSGKEVPKAYPEQMLSEALFELTEKRCGCLLIVSQEEELLGIFTDGDLRRCIQQKGPEALNLPLKELMTDAATTTSRHVLAWEAAKLMQKDPKKWIMMLPVIENNKVVGLLRMHDIIHAGL